MEEMTLEEYIKLNVANSTYTFTVQANTNSTTGITSFYIHPTNKSGMTVDFAVNGNELTTTCVCK